MSNTSNAYVAAMQARIEQARQKNASLSNLKKLQHMLQALSNETLANLLKSSNVDANVFSKSIYASEKVIKFAQQAIAFNANSLNEMTYAIFKSAVAFHNNELEFTKQDACAAISSVVKVDDKRKDAILAKTRRNLHFTTETIAAQSQTSLSALKSLNILKDSVERRNAYVLNINDLTKKLCENLKVELKEAA